MMAMRTSAAALVRQRLYAHTHTAAARATGAWGVAHVARTYVTKPTANRSAASSKAASGKAQFAETTAKELHPLPSAVKDAGKPSSASDTARYDASGNSVSPADLSSRPAAPGPSAPHTDAAKAAPRLAQAGSNAGSGYPSSSGSEGSEVGSGGEASLNHDWATSFSGMSTVPFPRHVAEILEAPINEEDIEIKPDGLLYMPEIKYRRVLNKAFGPGGWGLAPRSETNVSDKVVSREWALICLGRFVSTARGEQEYFDPAGVATASEGAKSNALTRCCKDLGIAHELWNPRFIRAFKDKKCVEVFVENISTGKKRKLWRRKDGPPFEYPWKESK